MVTAKKNKISIIIRTKNEEKWLPYCLEMISRQDYQDFEVILVDNKSDDNTIAIAKRFNVNQIIEIDKFIPGLALNMGIRASTGNFIVCLSAHCVPKDENWLSKLYANFDNPDVAGVYGRQLPINSTDPVDKRDLLIVFGKDKRIQTKDSFFHNANSMIKKEIWDRFPFNEEVSNIEDRVWGKEIINEGYKIVYEPDAPVYHHHGLHQGNAPERAKGVVSIIEKVEEEVFSDLPDFLKPENQNIVALIPIKKKFNVKSLDYELFIKLIDELKKVEYINDIYVLSDSQDWMNDLDIKFISREDIKGIDKMDLGSVLQTSLSILENKEKVYPDSILYVNYDYVFRPKQIFNKLIEEINLKGYDSIFIGLEDYGHYWSHHENTGFKQTDTQLTSRENRDPLYKALYGLGCLINSWVVRSGKIVDGSVGIIPVNDFRSSLRINEINSKTSYKLLSELHK